MTLVNSIEIENNGDAKDFNENDSETLFNLKQPSSQKAEKLSSSSKKKVQNYM